MPEPAPRKPKPYVARRVYTVLALGMWVAACVGGLYCLITERTLCSLLCIGLGAPIALPAIVMVIGLGAFPNGYSSLGPRWRTPLPDEPHTAMFAHSWIAMRTFSSTVPSVVWRVYPTGLGISIELFGDTFLPFAHIRRVEPGRFSVKVHHDCPEFNGPIRMPRKVYEAMRQYLHP